MGKTSYYTVNGQIIGERQAGGARRNYGVDALGSVTATILGSSIQNTYGYKPYGEQEQKTGIGADPAFRWTGVHGYQAQNRHQSEYYVRARVVSAQVARWCSRDPWWPKELAYAYGNGNPVTFTDATGLGACVGIALFEQAIQNEAGAAAEGWMTLCLLAGKKTSDEALAWSDEWGSTHGFSRPGHPKAEPCPDGTLCNALTHCMWACLLAQAVDKDCAKMITDMHEQDGPCRPYRQTPKDGRPNPPHLKNMDLFNNAVGIKCSSSGSCAACCTMNAATGNLGVVQQPPPPWKPSKYVFKKGGNLPLIPAIERDPR